jgi:hypothetical protein
MNITFNVGDSSAQFHRNAFTGLAYLLIDGEKISLASLTQRDTHFDYDTVKVWTIPHSGRTIEIEKVRPQLFGGLRPNTFTVTVDGGQVATARGF